MDKKKTDPKTKREFMENLAKRKAALAKNLLIARKATGTTQKELLGPKVSTRITISRIERGDGDPRLSSIVSLATTLGISPVLLLITGDELLELASKLENWKKNKTKIPPEDAVALELAPTGTRSQIDEVLELAQKALKPKGKAEKIGVAIGTVHKPGDGSHIGKSLGGALGI